MTIYYITNCLKKKRQSSCCYQASLPAAQSVVEQDVEDVTVECEEHGHAQELVPKRAAQENDNLEGNEDTLHGQEPGVDMVARTEEELEGKDTARNSSDINTHGNSKHGSTWYIGMAQVPHAIDSKNPIFSFSLGLYTVEPLNKDTTELRTPLYKGHLFPPQVPLLHAFQPLK